jgi:hypothetical protein
MSALGRAQEALDKYMEFEPKEMTTAEQEAFLRQVYVTCERRLVGKIYMPLLKKN